MESFDLILIFKIMTKQGGIQLLSLVIVILSLNVMAEGAVSYCQTLVSGSSSKCQICYSGYIPTLNR
jgi:hypothetical protein